MHTGTGTEIPFLNERYKELCAGQGCSIQEIGVKSNKEVVDYFGNLGYRTEWIRDRWQWISRIRLDNALAYIRSHAYSFTTLASDDVHSTVIERLESELLQKFGSLTSKIEVPSKIYLAIISRPG
jgi:hypothetical protein